MKLVNHGGACCGLRHIYGFHGPPDARTDLKKDPITRAPMLDPTTRAYIKTGKTELEKFDECIQQLRGKPGWDGTLQLYGKTIEVVLTDYQISQYPGWLEALRDRGFILVNRVRNTTNAVCNIFHQCPSQVRAPLAGWKGGVVEFKK